MPYLRHAALYASLLVLASAGRASAQQGAVGVDQMPERLQVRSEAKGLTFTMLDRLPRSPSAGRPPAEFCQGYIIQPKTPGGRTARTAGWSVTGEAPLGPLMAVSFASDFEPATSGTCVVQGGNVGIFNRDGNLVALAYAPRGSKLSIGKVSALEGGAVRIWDGEPPGMPVADIERRNEGYLLQLGALAPQETLCGGRAVVPNIYGKPINRARTALRSAGWAPIPAQPAPEKGSREGELAARGIPEVEGCSGTGFGYCSYGYRGAGGQLSVTTMGDDDFPTVSGYSATCP